jgi:hypothetical protein
LGGQVFSDVLNYSNDVGAFLPDRGRPLGCCTAGAGFDRASGWGSVNLGPFVSTALAFEPVQIHLSVPGKQHPLKQRTLLATVTCAGPCRVASFAFIKVGNARPFEADSPVGSLPAAGSKTFAIRLSRKALGRIRSGLGHRRKVMATLYAVTITGRRTVAFRTSGIRLRIRR